MIYLAPILKIDIINCKTKKSTITYLFALTIISKNAITNNIDIFEELNINQLDLFKKTLNLERFFLFDKKISKPKFKCWMYKRLKKIRLLL